MLKKKCPVLLNILPKCIQCGYFQYGSIFIANSNTDVATLARSRVHAYNEGSLDFLEPLTSGDLDRKWPRPMTLSDLLSARPTRSP